ncbi:MAG: aspartate aminotransferase family protein [Actinobacteria bacterium]|nr:MAG: aspartate aminotransferase family protein [Actinomycetota bacterium]
MAQNSSSHQLPAQGMNFEQVIQALDASASDDVQWRNGKAFSLAYNAGPEVLAVADEAYKRFAGSNALNTHAFPSLRNMQAEVLDMAGKWLGSTSESAGYFTSGGTESILMAVKAARDQYRRESSILHPNIVLATSAHAAFDKACAYFDVEVRRVAVQPDWRADVLAMSGAIDANTVLLVGSAPQYPQGVIDDISGIASLAKSRNINCHVDACMGGVSLAYLAKLGHQIPPWNLQVDGVTSISVDLHKFGYTSKGASVIMYANKRLRSYQGFVTDAWLGGTYASSGMLGTKSGGPIAAAWAVMHFLGDDGYLRLTQSARAATEILAKHIDNHAELSLLAFPDALLLSFTAHDPSRLNIFAVANEMWKRGWYIDRQQPPQSLHCTVNAIHESNIEEMINDLDASILIALASGQSGDAGAYGTL